MRNGGEENTPGRPKSDDFGRAVSRMAVAQICERVGFDGFKKSALDSLSDITIQYLSDLGNCKLLRQLISSAWKHIPSWLPALPDPTQKVEQARQRIKAERALLSLQKRLLSNGSAGASSSGISDNVNESGAVYSSQFLTMPLKSGKKDAFAPVIEAAKGEYTGKKLYVESLDLSLSKKGGGRTGHWLGRGDERDDKKRRAEYILRQSMENPQELTQLYYEILIECPMLTFQVCRFILAFRKSIYIQ
uniref:Transcription initiation factor TFIID subunit 8 n=1 Tax=Salix viminalis TaxID=40686 RepID=A0A6N2KQD8_SALVM